MRSGRIDLGLTFLDAAAALVAVWAASGLARIGSGQPIARIEWPAASWPLAFLLLWVLICDRMQLGRFYPYRSELMARVTVANLIAGLGAAIFTSILGPPLSGFQGWSFALYFFCVTGVIRMARRALYVHRHLGPENRHRVVIVGGGALARELAAALLQDPANRYEVAGFLAPETEEVSGVSPGLAVEDTVTTLNIPEYLIRRKIDQVYFTLPNSGDQDVLRLVAECREAGIAVAFVPHAYELFITRSVLRDIGGIPLVAVDDRRTSQSAPRLKALADGAIALLLLVLAVPVMAPVALVLLRLRGTAFKRESRCGSGGQLFTLYRFNVEISRNTLTSFERWLDITKISELPQLWNVVRGDMSLVGPRAESVQRVQHYSEWQKQRLKFRPGVTGYSQLYDLHGKGGTTEKARYDIQYSFGWSPLLEMTMIVQTLWFIVRRVASAILSPARPILEKNPLPSGLEVVSVNSSQPSTD
jgi:putative colanic acid biosysnthesis UDP-glucose lipid carrier transferase